MYRRASDEVRRKLNQALFKRIYVYADEAIEAEFTPPFAELIEADRVFTGSREQRGGGQDPAHEKAPGIGGLSSSTSAVHAIFNISSVDVSSNGDLVELRREFENPCPALKTAASRLSRGDYRRDRRGGERRITDTRGLLVRSLGMTQTLLTTSEVDELVVAYIAGATLVELAARFRVHRRTAAAHLSRRGITPRTRGLDPSEAAEACRLYADGFTLMEIGLRMGVSQGVIGRAVTKAGHELRPRGRRSGVTSATVS